MIRWSELFAYTLIGTATVCMLIYPITHSLGEAWGERLASTPSIVLYLFVNIFVTCVIIALAPLRTARFVHFRNLAYPSWIWSAALGVVASGLVVKLWIDDPTQPTVAWTDHARVISALLFGIITGSFIVELLSKVHRTRGQASKRANSIPISEPQNIVDWALMPEQPIESDSEDRFGYTSSAANRIAKHLLTGEACPTIGLIGPYGSGKTSILNLVEAQIHQSTSGGSGSAQSCDETKTTKHVYIASVGAWGHTTGKSIAQRILDAALDELANHVDCLCLADLPRQYRSAMEAAPGSLTGFLLGLLNNGEGPEDILQRFDPVLEALDAHLILFMEDLDRNETDTVMLSELQGLLNRLKQNVTRVRFVLAISSESQTDIDFNKLCDRYEMLTSLPPETVEHYLNQLASEFRTKYPDDIDLSPKFSDSSPKLDEPLSIPKAVLAMLDQPRTLRTAMRLIAQAWEPLHGEVAFNELVLVKTLQAASSSAFEFVANNYIELRGSFGMRSEEHRTALEQRWEQAMEKGDVSITEQEQAGEVLDALFFGWRSDVTVSSNTHSPQSIIHGPHAGIRLTPTVIDYWPRMFAEEVIGTRDQDSAQAILSWLNNQEDTTLAIRLVHEDGFDDTFERLVATAQRENTLFFDDTALRRITEQVHAELLRHHGVKADYDGGGFLSLWRMTQKRQPADDLESWLCNQIRVALQTSLCFANDIEHYWGRHNSVNNLQPALRGFLVSHVCQRVKEKGIGSLVRILDPSKPFLLHHLVRHQYDDAVYEAGDWVWLMDLLIEQAKIQADPICSQLAALISKTVYEHRQNPDTGFPEGPHQANRLDEDYLVLQFPDMSQRRQLMDMLVNYEPNVKHSEQVLELVEEIQKQARDWLEKNASEGSDVEADQRETGM